MVMEALVDMPFVVFTKARDRLNAHRFATTTSRNEAFRLLAWLSGERNGSGSIEPIVDIDITARTAQLVCGIIEELLPSDSSGDIVRQRIIGYRAKMAGAATTKFAPGPTSLV